MEALKSTYGELLKKGKAFIFGKKQDTQFEREKAARAKAKAEAEAALKDMDQEQP